MHDYRYINVATWQPGLTRQPGGPSSESARAEDESAGPAHSGLVVLSSIDLRLHFPRVPASSCAEDAQAEVFSDLIQLSST